MPNRKRLVAFSPIDNCRSGQAANAAQYRVPFGRAKPNAMQNDGLCEQRERAALRQSEEEKEKGCIVCNYHVIYNRNET